VSNNVKRIKMFMRNYKRNLRCHREAIAAATIMKFQYDQFDWEPNEFWDSLSMYQQENISIILAAIDDGNKSVINRFNKSAINEINDAG